MFFSTDPSVRMNRYPAPTAAASPASVAVEKLSSRDGLQNTLSGATSNARGANFRLSNNPNVRIELWVTWDENLTRVILAVVEVKVSVSRAPTAKQQPVGRRPAYRTVPSH